jgi:hypothetical protein
MSKPNPDKLKVLWQKGRNYFSSFFVELGAVRKEVGNDKEFASWCIPDLRIGVDVLSNMSRVLKKADAEIVRRELSDARAADRDTRRAKRLADRKAREEEKARIAIEKAQAKEADKKTRKQKSDKDRRKRKKQEQLEAYKASVRSNGNGNGAVVVKDDDELAARIKEAEARRHGARLEWIEASLDLAGLLYQARNRYKSDNEFGDWLDRYEINIGHTDRAALVNLGCNLQAMRKLLNETESTSYRRIWDHASKLEITKQ